MLEKWYCWFGSILYQLQHWTVAFRHLGPGGVKPSSGIHFRLKSQCPFGQMFFVCVVVFFGRWGTPHQARAMIGLGKGIVTQPKADHTSLFNRWIHIERGTLIWGRGRRGQAIELPFLRVRLKERSTTQSTEPMALPIVLVIRLIWLVKGTDVPRNVRFTWPRAACAIMPDDTSGELGRRMVARERAVGITPDGPVELVLNCERPAFQAARFFSVFWFCYCLSITQRL